MGIRRKRGSWRGVWKMEIKQMTEQEPSLGKDKKMRGHKSRSCTCPLPGRVYEDGGH